MEVVLEWKPEGRGDKGTLCAQGDEKVLHVDTGRILNHEFRAKFVNTLCEGRAGLDRSAIEERLRELCLDEMKRGPEVKEPCEGDLEGDDSIVVVRPERFITPQVSGLTVPVIKRVGDTLQTMWVTCIQAPGGERDMVPLPPCLKVQDTQLFIDPHPASPSPKADPEWSNKGRKAWLGGAPAPDPAKLFVKLRDQMAKFIHLPEDKKPGTFGLLVLWVILTYICPAWPSVPYLFIGGPLGSGKSRVFEVLVQLVYRALVSSSMTAACLFRSLHNSGGTLLLDEAERLKQASPDTGEIMSVLLAGYKRGGRATRLEPVDDTYRLVEFDCYGCKALACIAGLPPALSSRCLPLFMFRLPAGALESKRLVADDHEIWQALKDELYAFALGYGPKFLELARKMDVCPEMTGRDHELWQPLLALAEWIESCGVNGLLEVMRKHAKNMVESSRDEQTPFADELILRTLATCLRAGVEMTCGEILKKLQADLPEMFKGWTAKGISNVFRRYDIVTHKRTGNRLHRTAFLPHLLKVQQIYSMDLGIPEPKPQPVQPMALAVQPTALAVPEVVPQAMPSTEKPQTEGGEAK